MKALLLGGAETLWSDVQAVETLIGRPWDGAVIACNDAGVHWPRFLDHWCTLHPEQFRTWPDGGPGWLEQRTELGHPDGYVTWARRTPKLVDRLCNTWGGGSSGLLCVAVAEKVGVTHAILCGIPMEATPHFNDHHRTGRDPWPSADSHWRAWERPNARRRMETWVRSMSGRTRALLGAPTLEWLAAGGRKLEAA